VADPTTAPEQSFYFDLTGRLRPEAALIWNLADLDRITGLTGFLFLAGHYPVDPACRGEAFLRSLVDPVKK
jgi:hypothetical protein